MCELAKEFDEKNRIISQKTKYSFTWLDHRKSESSVQLFSISFKLLNKLYLYA